MGAPTTNPYRLLPSVEEVLSSETIAPLAARVRRAELTAFVGDVLDAWRTELKAGELDLDGLRERLARGDLVRAVASRVDREEKAGLVRVVNAAGVVLHTGLGRAPVHPEAARDMAEAAASYVTLEVDRFSGKRNQRDDRLGELLVRLTGAEAGIAVNNNAAAVLLVLNTFAQGKETIVSRGELVEIGGSFRMPDVMERAGTRLVEVGTTNKTRIADLRRRVTPDTGLLLKVHTSNFRLVGFTEEVGVEDLALLGRETGVATSFDLGSGLLEDAGDPPAGLDAEPRVRAAVAAGVDVVTFSGDKLLGGPQAGLLVGKAAAIRALRANPLYRALRLDKVTIAGLERTLALCLAGRGGEVPARAMLGATREALAAEARAIARELGALAGLLVDVVDDVSQPGSGSAPDVFLPTSVVRVRAAGRSADELASALRHGEPPVFGRIHEDALCLDPRTLLEGDRARLIAAFRALGGSSRGA
jgi:L-seryl-tRNA(Ser) seleniumtransferase